MKRGSSLRLTECPMPPTSGVVFGAMLCSLLRARRGRRVLHALDDVHVAGTATQVSGDRPPDVFLARARVGLQQRVARHHHPGRAVAALEAVLLPEALLDRIEL